MYRLLADVLNDLGFVLDCLSPIFPKPIRVVVLSFSSVLRALCGVAAGSAKASLSAHFARWGNLGELNAKDSSQETVISLVGMLIGSLVVSWVTEPVATWTTLILLLSIHLETNRRAVRAVSMRTLNRQRATLVYHHLKQGHVPTPEEISAQERIFEKSGVLRSSDDRVLGYCWLAGPMSRLLGTIASHSASQRSSVVADGVLREVIDTYEKRGYILWMQANSNSADVMVVVKQGAANTEVLISWWQALEMAVMGGQLNEKSSKGDADFQLLVSSAQLASDLFARYRQELEQKGFDLNTNALETGSASRISVDN